MLMRNLLNNWVWNSIDLMKRRILMLKRNQPLTQVRSTCRHFLPPVQKNRPLQTSSYLREQYPFRMKLKNELRHRRKCAWPFWPFYEFLLFNQKYECDHYDCCNLYDDSQRLNSDCNVKQMALICKCENGINPLHQGVSASATQACANFKGLSLRCSPIWLKLLNPCLILHSQHFENQKQTKNRYSLFL